MRNLIDKPKIFSASAKVLHLLDCLANTAAYGAEDAYVIKHNLNLLACIFPVSTKNAEVRLHHERSSNGYTLYSLDCADSQIGALYSRLLTQINHYVKNNQNINEFLNNSKHLVQSDYRYAPISKDYQNTLGELKLEIEAQNEARYREEGDEEGFVHVLGT